MPVEKSIVRITYFSLFSNLCLAVVKAIAGIFGNSFALIADAIESSTDVFASLLVLLGLHYAGRPADENHPYGHGKIEPIITFGIVAFLVTSATVIAYKSIQNIQTPHDAPQSWTLVVLIAIIIWKEISYQLVARKSSETHSTALKAEAWHHRSDAITSIAAFIGISIALLFGEGYESADDWAALFASGFIMYNCYGIFRPALGEIMDEQVYDELLLNIREVAHTVPGVKGTEKCFIRKAGMKYYVDLHAIVEGNISVRDGHEIAHRLKEKLIMVMPQLAEVLIHIEPYEME